jgi:hypothetical protein
MGEGRGRGGEDLTLIGVIDRRVRLPLSKWRGYGVDFFSALMGELGFQVKVWIEEVWASPPWGTRTRAIASGRRERGFVRFLPHPDSDGFSSGRIPPLPAGEGRVRVDSVSKDSFSCKLFYSLFNSKNAGL